MVEMEACLVFGAARTRLHSLGAMHKAGGSIDLRPTIRTAPESGDGL